MSTKKKDTQRRYERTIGNRRYKRRVVISTEGRAAEPQYFNFFNSDTTVLHVKILKDSASDPKNVLKQLQQELKKHPLRKNDQAWVVIDKDEWQDDQIKPLFDWSKTNPKYGFALSNPMFEYWLLLHFEDPPGISSPQDCINKLNKHLPGYDKKIVEREVKLHIQEAIDRAKRQDSPPCNDWPRGTGTTVYRLVEELRKDQNL